MGIVPARALASRGGEVAEQIAEVFPPLAVRGATWDEGLQVQFLAVAEADGISKEDLAAAPKVYSQHGSPERLSDAEAEAVMQAQWGAEYDTKLQAALDAVKDRPALKQFLIDTGLGNDPTVLNFLADRGANRQTIQAEIDRLSSTPEYRQGDHINHSRRVEEVRLLFRRLYAGH